jgi:ABC-type glycerol-3-phosphate transport system substrate-binding protein
MKKTFKRVVSLSLALSMALSMAACKKEDKNETTTKTGDTKTEPAKKTYEKPSVVNVTWDGTILKEGDEDTDALYKAYNEAYGFEVKWTRPDHSGYSDAINQVFSAGDTSKYPDAFLLSAENYVSFAARGLLYNFKEDWDNSDIRDSVDSKGNPRFTASFLESVSSLYTVEGKSGELGLYGLPTTRGNGCVTYVRESWLEKIGKKAEDIKTYQDYMDMLTAMQKANLGDGGAVVTAAGYISKEAPYTNYLPEFYQDAYPDFIMGADGKYVDGFQLDNMKEALKRLATAKQSGLLDPDMSTNGTSQARNKFIENKCGVFTYWAGTWKKTLGQNIINKDKTWASKTEAANFGDVVALKPIAEVGKYIERMAPVVVISKTAKNPEGIYKYFVEPIYDGDKVMSVWMYGAKGVHWSDEGETEIQNLTAKVTDADGKVKKDENGKEITEITGTKEVKSTGFHFKLNKSKTAVLAKNNIDPLLAVCEYLPNKNPAGEVVNASNPVAYECQMMFNDNCKPAPALLSNATLAQNLNDINNKRREVVAAVVDGTMTYDEAMKDYKDSVGDKIDACLKSLNED